MFEKEFFIFFYWTEIRKDVGVELFLFFYYVVFDIEINLIEYVIKER